jgi:hypothetical protein
MLLPFNTGFKICDQPADVKKSEESKIVREEAQLIRYYGAMLEIVTS